jgi:hypothetical protein
MESPANVGRLVDFVGFLIHTHPQLAPKTVDGYVSTVRARLAILGVSLQRSPFLSRLLLRLRQQPRLRTPDDQRIPATIPLVTATVTDAAIPLATRAAIAVAFEALLRASEYTATGIDRFDPDFTLLRRHVRLRPDLNAFELMLPRSKGDVYNTGAILLLHDHPSRPHCAFRTLAAYLHATPDADPNQPLFIHHDGRFLVPAHVSAAIRVHAERHGLPPYMLKPHSLRIGAAMALLDAGVPWATVKVLGRWKSDDVVLLYTRMSSLRSLTASAALSDPHPPLSIPFFASIAR